MSGRSVRSSRCRTRSTFRNDDRQAVRSGHHRVAVAVRTTHTVRVSGRRRRTGARVTVGVVHADAHEHRPLEPRRAARRPKRTIRRAAGVVQVFTPLLVPNRKNRASAPRTLAVSSVRTVRLAKSVPDTPRSDNTMLLWRRTPRGADGRLNEHPTAHRAVGRVREAGGHGRHRPGPAGRAGIRRTPSE
jgi:hypothetical protein